QHHARGARLRARDAGQRAAGARAVQRRETRVVGRELDELDQLESRQRGERGAGRDQQREGCYAGPAAARRGAHGLVHQRRAQEASCTNTIPKRLRPTIVPRTSIASPGERPARLAAGTTADTESWPFETITVRFARSMEVIVPCAVMRWATNPSMVRAA